MPRKRSMSACVATPDDRLSKKFEGVASDDEVHFDSEDEAKDGMALSDEWTQQDYDSLVAQLRETLPENDHRKWKTSLQHVNWKQIRVREHATEEVEKVGKQLIGKVQSSRTLTEILNDVSEVVTKMLTPEPPKAPLTAYNLFVQAMMPQLREQYKDLTGRQIYKVAADMYRQLSTKKLRPYEEKAIRLKEEYYVNAKKFKQDHPELPRKMPRGSKEVLQTPFQLFYQSLRGEKVPFQQARKEWDQLPLKQKIKFIRASFNAQADTDSNLLNKKEQLMLAQSFGKPEFVGNNAYEFFRRKVRSQYATANGTERELQIQKKYKNLDAREHLNLKQEFLVARSTYINQYQQYINKLPKGKRQAEVDFLKTVTEKSSKYCSSPRRKPEMSLPSRRERLKGTKAAKTKETPKEPEKPPKCLVEFYRQRFYKGKVGQHAESFAKLTAARKQKITEHLKTAQNQYLVDFEQFLNSLSKDEIRKYMQNKNAQKQAQSSVDDSEGESSSEE